MRREIALACALVIAGSVALLTVLVYFHSREMLGAAVLREFRAAVAATAVLTEQSLDDVKKDVLTFTGMPPVRGLLRALRSGGYDAETQFTSEMWLEHLAQIMISLLRNNPDYWQAGFIDVTGRELMRVDNLDGTLTIAPSNVLQKRADSADFSETMKLPPGGVHVSRLSLNREDGRIELPYRPTLRIATPVYDWANQIHGIIFINLQTAGLAKKILARFQSRGGQSYLVNPDGSFLVHPDTARTFGFELDHDYRLQQIHPRLVEKLRDTEVFIEIVDSGELKDAKAHIHGFQKIQYDPNESRNYWAIVYEVPSSIALEPIFVQRNWQLCLGIAIALLGAIAAFFWSARMTRPLKELTITANHIASGNYDRRVELSGKRNEVRELSAAFNQMVEALVTAERRLANIFDAAGDAIISVDQNQKIIAFNNAASQIFGYRPFEVLGRPLELLLPEDAAAVHQRHFRAYGQEDGSTRKMGSGREVSGRRSDGSTFPAEVSISKTFERIGATFTAILRDVTERKRAETDRAQFVINLKNAVAEANRNQAQLKAVFHAMEDGIAVLDMQGNVVLLNEAQARICGYPDPEEMKRNLTYFAGIYELTEPDGTRVPVAGWPASRCLNGETMSNWVLHARRLDSGQEWYFRFSGAPIHDQEGEQILAAIVTRDITEFKKVESEILRLNAHLEKRVKERTAELEAANQELEAFSYSVSHDLRAPLRAIDGFSQAVLEDYAVQLDETGRQYLNRVRAGSVRMANLIDDMLQLSRVGRAQIERQIVDLSSQADSVLTELQSAEPDRYVEITIESGLEAEGDPKLLRIALVNLISNAWKFTGLKPGPRIGFGAVDHAGERAYYVRDNGVGFDMAYVDKLFGAFQRLHTENEFPGTGIGLAIAQRIIHRHGGRIWAESAVNQGATIYFTIPSNDSTTVDEYAGDE